MVTQFVYALSEQLEARRILAKNRRKNETEDKKIIRKKKTLNLCR